eukprot:ANDGO_04855.mRNA.1 mitochondrial L-2-hydroxyglutarate dehydrogenase
MSRQVTSISELCGAKIDFLVVGAGIVGLSVVRALQKAHPFATVAVVERATTLGVDASGRNSGVMHAGFYYAVDSLKAQFCRKGNEEWRQYCEAHRIPIRACGKLVVARGKEELGPLDLLLERGRLNGCRVEKVSASEAMSLEPSAKTHEYALWSPQTFSLNPKQVLETLCDQVRKAGAMVRMGCSVVAERPVLNTDGWMTVKVQASMGEAEAGAGAGEKRQAVRSLETRMLINCAGLYADHIAHACGHGLQYTLLPFKGLYLKHVGEAPSLLKRHIYPVPNLKNPFLGTHFTLTADGHVKIGPTAIPALWRRQYGGMDHFSWKELAEIAETIAKLALFPSDSFRFWNLAIGELQKYYKPYLIKSAQGLVNQPLSADEWEWTAPGNRSQLFNGISNGLEMDFVVHGDDKTVHVLNAVSPAFTCAFPFADHIVNAVIPRFRK